MEGTVFHHVTDTIIIAHISGEARDLLDRIMEAWEQHKNGLPTYASLGDLEWNPQESIYGFAYWLVRWSGLIQPTERKED